MTAIDSAKELVYRAAEKGQRGKTIPHAEMMGIIDELVIDVPSWLIDLFVTVPLAGLELGWQAFVPEPSFDGKLWMEWSDARNIRSESLECYPGLAILGHGYINVASCSHGCGDPYFVCVNEGNDPPIYQVYHDISDKPELILAECRVVAPTLSQFFRDALLLMN